MKHLTINNIYIFKLVTGEELIAKVVGKSDDAVEVSNPINMILTPQGLQMVPSLFSAEPGRTIQLNNSSWVMTADAREDVKNSWIEATTGIRPVTKQIITG